MIGLLQRFMRAAPDTGAGGSPGPARADAPSQHAPEVARALADFDGAVRATERAWHQSSLLALARARVVKQALETLAQGEPEVVADMLARMTHESFLAAAPHVPGLEVQGATRLSRIVIGILARDMAAQLGSPRDPEAAADALLAGSRAWIETGKGRHPDLERIADLVGSAGVRAALIAPLCPAAASLRIVARARHAHFGFREPQSDVPA